MCQHVGLAYFEVSEVDSSFCHGRAALQSGSHIAYPSQFLSSILPRPLSPPEWAAYQLFFFCYVPLWLHSSGQTVPAHCHVCASVEFLSHQPPPPSLLSASPCHRRLPPAKERERRPNNTPSTIQGWTLTASEQWMEATVLLPRFTCGRHWELSRKRDVNPSLTSLRMP